MENGMKRSFALTLAAAATLFSATSHAQQSPVGLWKNIDDESGKPKALIRITESGGVLSGKIEKLFREPSEEQNPKCDKCEGAQNNQPIIGMTILSNMKRDGDEYDGGNILDPNNGKVYKSSLELKDSGKKLSVRGYIGIPLLGRSQVWIREE
jgi:uncharacterized protein (DUF2147 family)